VFIPPDGEMSVDNPGTYASYDNMVEMTYSLGGGNAVALAVERF